MSLLSVDYQQRARAKRDALVEARRRTLPPEEGKGEDAEAAAAPTLASAPPEEEGTGEEAAVVAPSAATPPPDQRSPEEKEARAVEDVLGDKVVSLKEAPPRSRGSSSKDAPATLEDVGSEEDLAKLTLDGLKRLARAASVDPPKPLNKARLLSSLLDVYRRGQQRPSARPSGIDEEEEEASLGSSCTR